MAKKVTGIICGCAWAVFGFSFLTVGPTGDLSDAGVVLFVLGMMIGIFSLIALIVLALIDYARRPR